MLTAPDLVIRCSFCTKERTEVAAIVAGPGSYICNECVDLCVTILASPATTPTPASLIRWEDMADEAILAMLPQIASVATQVDDNLGVWVQRLRGRGMSWARIGASLGMARQSAWERFSDRNHDH